VKFNPENQDLFNYTDFRGNQFIPPDAPHFNKRVLLLGLHNG